MSISKAAARTADSFSTNSERRLNRGSDPYPHKGGRWGPRGLQADRKRKKSPPTSCSSEGEAVNAAPTRAGGRAEEEGGYNN